MRISSENGSVKVNGHNDDIGHAKNDGDDDDDVDENDSYIEREARSQIPQCKWKLVAKQVESAYDKPTPL